MNVRADGTGSGRAGGGLGHHNPSPYLGASRSPCRWAARTRSRPRPGRRRSLRGCPGTWCRRPPAPPAPSGRSPAGAPLPGRARPPRRPREGRLESSKGGVKLHEKKELFEKEIVFVSAKVVTVYTSTMLPLESRGAGATPIPLIGTDNHCTASMGRPTSTRQRGGTLRMPSGKTRFEAERTRARVRAVPLYSSECECAPTMTSAYLVLAATSRSTSSPACDSATMMSTPFSSLSRAASLSRASSSSPNLSCSVRAIVCKACKAPI